jgi:hypothetical protein
MTYHQAGGEPGGDRTVREDDVALKKRQIDRSKNRATRSLL